MIADWAGQSKGAVGTTGGETEVSWGCYHVIIWVAQSILGLSVCRKDISRIIDNSMQEQPEIQQYILQY